MNYTSHTFEAYVYRSIGQVNQKGKRIMIRKIVLILIMGLTLAGAAATSTPIPVLLVMGCLIIFALSVVRGEQQE
jgi:hypothetical protein